MYEIDWAFLDGPKTFAPNLYDYFTGLFKYKDDIIKNYYDKIVNQNSKLHSWVWHDYERILSQINPEKIFLIMKKRPFAEGRASEFSIHGITLHKK